MEKAQIYFDDKVAPIGVVGYTPGRTEFQTITGIGGDQARVPVRQLPGRIQFVINPEHGLKVGSYEIQFEDGRVIMAHLDTMKFSMENGKSIEIYTGLTNP